MKPARNPDELSHRYEEIDSRKTERTLSFAWLWPVYAGLVLGLVVLAPLSRSPGDPTGRSIGSGIGGMLGLAVALVWRALGRRKAKTSDTKAKKRLNDANMELLKRTSVKIAPGFSPGDGK